MTNEICATSDAEKKHFSEQQDAPEFKEWEYRTEAALIVHQIISKDPIEALEILTNSDDSYEIALSLVRQFMQKDEHLTNTFITTVLKTHESEIQEKLENEL